MKQFIIISRKTKRPIISAPANSLKELLEEAAAGGVDLSWAELPKSDLSDADLSHIILNGANLRGSEFQGAILKNAKLRYADMRDSHIYYVDFRNADLRNANLTNAHIYGIKPYGMQIRGASMDSAALKMIRHGGVVESTEIIEAAPPGMEDWIMDRKESFKKQYGDRWEEVLYATAWKEYNKKNEDVEFKRLMSLTERLKNRQ